MLNYVWAGLIIFSLLFAAIYDAQELITDSYRNGESFELTLEYDESPDANRRVPVQVNVDADYYSAFYDTGPSSGTAAPAGSYEGVLITTQDGRQLRFAQDAAVPEPWATIREITSERDNDMRGRVTSFTQTSDSTASVAVRFATVRFVKMNAIAGAAFSMAETAVTLAIGLIGVIALWMGLLQIGQKAGLIDSLVRFTQPVLRPLFPEIPEGHPALGMIVLNLTANVLGLGNAATPLGIKAMEELQELNPDPDSATNSMVMLLAMNTASVQLVPPVMLVALMGLQINKLIFAIIIVTGISLIVAITSAKLLQRLPRYQATDPNRLAGAGAGPHETPPSADSTRTED
ncbi:MAG: nucleoside recognition protein [Rhodothermales bacterium]|nr:nucleoside recognition protein [Rhodothermales bacterium]